MPRLLIDSMRVGGVNNQTRDFIKRIDRAAPEESPPGGEAYRSAQHPAPSCPACHAPLQERREGRLTLRACPDGHGVFLPRRAALPWAIQVVREARIAARNETKSPIAGRAISGCLITLGVVGAVLIFAIGMCFSAR